MHVFVDETKARGYLVAAATVLPADLTATRRTVDELRKAGQRRIHFTKESDARRKQIITTLATTGVETDVYDARQCPDREARRLCLEALVDNLADHRQVRLIIERDDSVLSHDKRTLFERVRKANCADRVEYSFLRAHEESLLTIPDAVAWCWAKGGHWRSGVQPLVRDVHRL